VLGYFLGRTIPALGENIDLVIMLILAFSVIPIVYEWWRHRRTNAAAAGDVDGDGRPDRNITGLETEPRES
jgi:membrane-associated protein